MPVARESEAEDTISPAAQATPDGLPLRSAASASEPEITDALRSRFVRLELSSRVLRLAPWVVIALYAALVAVGVAHHEPWADEAQAWQLARTLPLRVLLVHALHYEGHPGLWYIFLHLLLRAGVSYTGMRWATAAIALCGIALLVLRSPFPAWVRYVLPFTFWLSFQYAVVARSYVLGPLLLFALATVWRRRNALPAALLVLLLANLSLHFLCIGLGFVIIYAVELRRGERTARHIVPAALIVALGFAVALATVLPFPIDLAPVRHSSIPWFPRMLVRFMRCGVYLASALSTTFYLGAAMALAVVVAFWGHRKVLYSLPILLLAGMSGAYFNFWHLGLAIQAVIAIAWMLWPLEACTRWQARTAAAVFFVWLGIQLTSTVHSFVYDYRHPYAPDLAAAQYLKPLVDSGATLALTEVKDSQVRGFHSIGLAPYFSRPLFLNQPQPYWVWSTREHTAEMFRAALAQHPTVVVAVYFNEEFGRFDPARDLQLPNMQFVLHSGYRLTRTFCAQKPEGIREREQICELIFQPATAIAESVQAARRPR